MVYACNPSSFRRLRQEDHKFQASMGNLARPLRVSNRNTKKMDLGCSSIVEHWFWGQSPVRGTGPRRGIKYEATFKKKSNCSFKKKQSP